MASTGVTELIDETVLVFDAHSGLLGVLPLAIASARVAHLSVVALAAVGAGVSTCAGPIFTPRGRGAVFVCAAAGGAAVVGAVIGAVVGAVVGTVVGAVVGAVVGGSVR